jgi:hypothetical protein
LLGAEVVGGAVGFSEVLEAVAQVLVGDEFAGGGGGACGVLVADDGGAVVFEDFLVVDAFEVAAEGEVFGGGEEGLEGVDLEHEAMEEDEVGDVPVGVGFLESGAEGGAGIGLGWEVELGEESADEEVVAFVFEAGEELGEGCGLWEAGGGVRWEGEGAEVDVGDDAFIGGGEELLDFCEGAEFAEGIA